MTTQTAAERLEASGLSVADGRALGIKELSPAQTARLQAHFREVPSMFIPYHGTDGVKNDFYRVRYLAPVSGWSQGRKYDGPQGAAPKAYFPKLIPWAPIVTDARIPITITEGELKAAKGCASGLNCIGLGGVWSWRSKRLGQDFLPELDTFVWSNRPVELCFDSDIVVKPEVRAAMDALGTQLANRGAIVRMVLLPQQGDDDKVGLDDYLKAHGLEKYLALDRIPLNAQDERRRNFRARFVYLHRGDLVYDLQTDMAYRSRAHFVNAYGYMTTIDLQGRERQLVSEWYKDPQRVSLPGYCFEPHNSARMIPSLGLNLFRGLAVEPRRGSVEPMLKTIDAIVGSRPEVRRWFLQWLAYPLQHPGTKLSTCVFVYSAKQGVGKTAIGEVMLDIYGRLSGHGVNLSEEDFFGSWNEWVERGLFGLCDELSFDGSKKSRSVFKRYVTGENTILSAKWRDRSQVQNRTNFYFTSNNSGGLPLEGGGNRRVLVIEAQKVLGLSYFTTTFDKWRKEQGASSWLYYLLHQVDLSDFHPFGDAPTTEEEATAIQSSGSVVELWLAEALARPPLRDHDIWTVREILNHYQLETSDHRSNAGAMGRALGALPDASKVRPTSLRGVQEQSLWCLRRREHWRRASTTQIRAAWEAAHPQPAGEEEETREASRSAARSVR